MPRGTQVKRDRLAVTVERRDISRELALRRLSCPQFPVRSVKDHSGGETVPRGVGLSVRSGLKVSGGPHTSSHPNNTWEALWVLITVGGQSVGFLWDTGTNFLCAHWSPWSIFLLIHYCNGTVRISQMRLLQSSFKLQLGLCAVVSRVSDPAAVSLTPSWEGYIEQGPGLCFHEYGACSFSPINWTKCKP